MYDEYVKKIEKLSKIKNVIYKFRFLIIGSFLAIVTLVTVLLSIKGNISDFTIPDSIDYGNKYDASSDALMSDIIRYEYRNSESDEWIEGLPEYPGEYYVRAVAKRSFNSIGYSEEKKITINKRELNLSLENKTISYGYSPKIKADNLSSTDKITKYIYTFEDITKASTLVNINLDSIVISNQDNEDVTNCYDIKYNEEEISFNKRELNIKLDGNEKTYDGNPIQLKNTYTITPELGYEDKIEVSEYEIKDSSGNVVENAITPGTYKVDIKTYDVKSNSGSTIINYNPNITTATLTINKRPIKFITESNEYIYDGVSHFDNNFIVDSNYSLVDGEIAQVGVNNTSIIHYGSTNNIFNILIYDNDNNDISDYYDIDYEYGLLKINKKELIVNTEEDTITYDGASHVFDEYEVIGLISTDSIDSISTPLSFKNSGEYDNKFSVNILNSDDYNIKYIYGKITILKKDIILNPIDKEFTYGEEITYSENEYNTIGLASTDDNSVIDINVSYWKNDEKVTPKNSDTYEIRIESYNSDNYNITSDTNGILTINKFIVNATLNNVDPGDIIYDGNYHSYPNEYGNYTSNNQLPFDEKIKLNVTYNDNYDLPLNASTYIIKYDDTFEVLNGIIDNYNVNVINTTSIIINKKLINTRPIDISNKTYDGTIYEYPTDLPFIHDELVGNDSLAITGVNYSGKNTSSTNPKDADTYKVSIAGYEFLGDTNPYNYETSETYVEFTIYPKDINITPLNYLLDEDNNKQYTYIYSGKNLYYDDSDDNFMESANLVVDSKTNLKDVIKISINVIFNNTYVTNIKNVGTYKLVVNNYNFIKGNENNYNITLLTQDFTIDKKPVTFSLNKDVTEKDYDGLVVNIGYTVNGLIDGESVNAYVDYKNIDPNLDENYILDSGSYNVSFGSYDVNNISSNYDVDISDSFIFIVNKINIDIDLLDKNYTYGDVVEYGKNEYDTLGLITGDTKSAINVYVKYYNNLDEEIVLNALDFYDAGVYEIRLDSYESRNYIINANNSTLTIDKYELNIELLSMDSINYDGNRHPYNSEFANYNGNKDLPGNEKIKVFVKYDGEDSLPKNAKTYTVSYYDYEVSTTLKSNYNITCITDIEFIINPKPITISPLQELWAKNSVGIDVKYNTNNSKDYNSQKYYYKDEENNFIDPKDLVVDCDTDIKDSATISVVYKVNDVIVDEIKNANTYTISINSLDDIEFNNGLKTNYDITIGDDVTFIINPKKVTFTPFNYLYLDGEKINFGVIYNGKVFNYLDDNDNFNGSDSLVTDIETNIKDSAKISVTFRLNNEIITSVKNAGTYKISIDSLDDIDFTIGLKSNYEITCKDSTFVINKKTITISPLESLIRDDDLVIDTSNGQDYNGHSYHYNDNEYDNYVSDDELVLDSLTNYVDRIKIITKTTKNNVDVNEIKNAGTYTISPYEVKFFNNDIEIDGNNYDVNYEDVNFIINQFEIKIELISPIDGNTKEYNGQEEVYTYEVYNKNGVLLVDNITFNTEKVNAVISYKGNKYNNLLHVDKYVVTLDLDETNIENGSLDNYKITFTNDTFTINKKDLIIYFSDGIITESTYDGKNIDVDSLYNNVIVEGYIDTYTNWYKIIFNNNENFIPKEVGTYKATIKISNEYVINDYNITNDDSFDYVINQKELKIIFTKYNSQDNSYDINDEIISGNTKVYDSLYVVYKYDYQDGYEPIETDFNYINVTIKYYSSDNEVDSIDSIINVGSYIIKASEMSGNSSILKNYKLIEVIDNFEITKRDFTVSFESLEQVEKTYDGQAISVSIPYSEGKAINDEFTYDYVYVDSNNNRYNIAPKNVDTYHVSVGSIDIINNNVNVNSNYNIINETTENDITYVINKKDINIDIKSNLIDDKRIYDGEIYTGYYYEILDDLAYGDNITLELVAKNNGIETYVKEQGTYVITYKSITYSPASVANNYNLIINDTSINVTELIFDVYLDNGLSSNYNGKYYIYNNFVLDTVENKELFLKLVGDDFRLVVKYDDEYSEKGIKDVGLYKITIDVDATNNTISEEEKDNIIVNYHDTYTVNEEVFNYYYEIKPQQITIAPTGYNSLFINKTYDMVAYENYDGNQYAIIEDIVLPEGEKFKIDVQFKKLQGNVFVDCNQILDANTYQVVIKDNGVIAGNENTSLANYDISTSAYTITINKVQVSLSPDVSSYKNGNENFIYNGTTYPNYDMSTNDIKAIFETTNDFSDVTFEATNSTTTYSIEQYDDKKTTSNIKNAGYYVITIDNSTLKVYENGVLGNINNYEIVENTNYFIIDKRPVSIELSIANPTKVYDGITYVYDENNGDTYQCVNSTSFIGNAYLDIELNQKPVLANTYNLTLDLNKTKMIGDLITNYNITSNTVVYKINKRPITIIYEDKITEYNGKKQGCDIISSEGLITGQTIKQNDYTLINVTDDKVKDQRGVKIYKGNSEVTSSYNITYNYAYLTITKKNLTLKTASLTVTYDGKSHQAKSFDIITGLCDNDKININSNESFDVIGTYNNEFGYDITNSLTKKSAIDNYNIDYSLGVITINKRQVEVIGFESKTSKYNGEEISLSKKLIQYQTGSASFVNKDIELELVNGNLIDAGIYTNIPVKITFVENEDCYDFINSSTNTININITSIPLTITTPSKQFVYDGNSHSYIDGVVYEGLIEGQFANTLSGVSITEGNCDNEIEFEIRDSNNNLIDKTNYAITWNYGKLDVVKEDYLEIRIKDIEYTGSEVDINESDIVVYNKNTNEEVNIYSVTIDSLIYASNIINIGTYYCKIYVTLTNGSSNIELSYNSLEFKIVPRKITININDYEGFTFDGELHEMPGDNYEIVSGSVLPGEKLVIVGDTKIYCGNVQIGLGDYEITNGDKSNYDIEVVNKGKLKIQKYMISVTTLDATFNYDGLDHDYRDGYTVSGYNNIFNKINTNLGIELLFDVKSYKTIKDYSQNELDNIIDNVIKLKVIDGYGNESYTDSNGYIIDYSKAFQFDYVEEGTLTIEKGQLFINVDNVYEKFGDTYHPTYNITLNDSSIDYSLFNVSFNIDGYYYSQNTFKEIDKSKVVVLDNSNNDITYKFDITSSEYNVIINPYSIKIITETKEATYETTLRNEKVYIYDYETFNQYEMINNGDGTFTYELTLECGNKVTISLTANTEISIVGSVENSYKYLLIMDSNNNDVTDCFDVDDSIGTLTIEA